MRGVSYQLNRLSLRQDAIPVGSTLLSCRRGLTLSEIAVRLLCALNNDNYIFPGYRVFDNHIR